MRRFQQQLKQGDSHDWRGRCTVGDEKGSKDADRGQTCRRRHVFDTRAEKKATQDNQVKSPILRLSVCWSLSGEIFPLDNACPKNESQSETRSIHSQGTRLPCRGSLMLEFTLTNFYSEELESASVSVSGLKQVIL